MTTITEWLTLGKQAHRSGELARAEQLYREVVREAPDRAEAWYLLGAVCEARGQLATALASLERAVQIQPNHAEAQAHLGVALARQGRFAEAAVSLRAAIRVKPDFAQTHVNLANVLRKLGQLGEAAACCRQALLIDSRLVAAYVNLGIILTELGQWDAALASLQAALRFAPGSASAHNSLGMLHARRGNDEAATASFERAVLLQPDFAEAHNNLGISLKVQSRVDEALASYRRALACKADFPAALSNLGLLHADERRLSEALACYEEGLRLDPEMAEARKNRSLVWLLQGNLAQGFADYEWRFRCPEFHERSCPQPRWDGGVLAGRTILLHAEQGLGDTLQFIRYAALVQRRGGSVVVECQAPLVHVLKGCSGIDILVARGSPLPAFDVHAPLMSLPHLLGTTLATIPAEIPYLQADPVRVEHWRAKLGSGKTFKIGIAWQGNRAYPPDQQRAVEMRTVPLHQFTSLARLPGVQLISLQKGPGEEQLATLPDDCPVTDFASRLDRDGAFLDTAAVMKVVDLVVTSDTSVAHLAGALGVPVWVAVPYAGDWRWLLNRDDSPWYPTMRLFRQERPGDWEEVFQRIAEAVRGRIKPEPTSAPAYNSMGIALAQRQQSAAAADCFRQALRCQPDFSEAHNNLGNVLRDLGRLDEAEQRYRRAIELRPDFASAHNNLGSLLRELGQLEQAETLCRTAVRLQPALAEGHNNLAMVLAAQGKLDEAVAGYQQAIRLQPAWAMVYSNLGAALAQQGKLEEAAASCRRAIALQPAFAGAHANLAMIECQRGNLLRSQGKLDEAVACYHSAIRFRPDCAIAHSNLGLVLKEQKKLEESVVACQEALRLDPQCAPAHNNLGTTLEAQDKLEEAAASYRQALSCDAKFPEAYSNLGSVLARLDRLDEALAACEQAVQIKPDYAEGHYNLGFVLRQQGRLAEALTRYEEALRLQPEYADAHWNRALAWLMCGDWRRGWSEYEWRWRRAISPPRPFAQPPWDGSALEGRTLLLHAEQGLGDTLQFIRYAPIVKGLGGTVVVECQPPLVYLLADCPGIDKVVTRGTSLPPFDVHAPLLSLPLLLGTTLATVPANVPYLHADPRRIERWRSELGNGGPRKIGIAWQGNPDYHADRQRSVPLACFAELGRLPDVQLFSLQKGPGVEQLADRPGDWAVTDLGSRLDQDGAFLDTAAVMTVVDLVVTSDTAVAHLAGALGVPVWVALPFAADWRWLVERADSPWYPTMRLFRQQRPGDWNEVFHRIAQALHENRRCP